MSDRKGLNIKIDGLTMENGIRFADLSGDVNIDAKNVTMKNVDYGISYTSTEIALVQTLVGLPEQTPPELVLELARSLKELPAGEQRKTVARSSRLAQWIGQLPNAVALAANVGTVVNTPQFQAIIDRIGGR